MGQFVGKEKTAGSGFGLIVSPVEGDMVADGEGLSVQGFVEPDGARIGMQADRAQIHAETGLHVGAQRRRQGIAATLQGRDLALDGFGQGLFFFGRMMHPLVILRG
jgi:hypothetical protein